MSGMSKSVSLAPFLKTPQKMSSQELEAENGGFASDVLKLLAVLHLNSADESTSSAIPTAAAAAAATTCRSPVSSAARFKKRRSSSSSYFRKFLCKRANLHPSATRNRPLFLTPPSPPPLQINPSFTETTQVSDSSKSQFLKSPSPENSKNNNISLFTPPTLLPRPLHHSLSGPFSSETYQKAAAQAVPPPLCRSISDPISPECYHLAAAADTPLQPPAAARTLSRSPVSDQDSKDEYENESGEGVWIEQIGGEGLIIHFKCPCGEGYEILLSGNTCYYKLI